MKTNRERVEQIRRAIEDSDCEHGDFMCAYCENAMIERALNEAVREAVEAEREACAKVASEYFSEGHYRTDAATAGKWIAKAIRARSGK